MSYNKQDNLFVNKRIEQLTQYSLQLEKFGIDLNGKTLVSLGHVQENNVGVATVKVAHCLACIRILVDCGKRFHHSYDNIGQHGTDLKFDILRF